MTRIPPGPDRDGGISALIGGERAKVSRRQKNKLSDKGGEIENKSDVYGRGCKIPLRELKENFTQLQRESSCCVTCLAPRRFSEESFPVSRGCRHWPADAPSTGKSVNSELSPFDANRHRRQKRSGRSGEGATLRPPETA